MASPKRTFLERRPVLSALGIGLLLWVFLVLWSGRSLARFALHPFALASGDKSYLVLFQNNYELRPTGGFISSFGILNVRNGLPLSFTFEDVYGEIDDHPFVDPPTPLNTLLAHPTYKGHSFRDANIYPDFPSSVSELEYFLHKTRPLQRLDGVLAVDMTFLENLLKVTGSVKVDGQRFDSIHLLEQIENMTSNVDLHDLDALKNRKSFLKGLIKKVSFRAFLPWNTAGILHSVTTSLQQKHALLFFRDEGLQHIVTSKNWGGTMHVSEDEDFLAVVDSNFGGGKSNRYVHRSIFYTLDIEHGTGSLDVRYDHPGEYYLPLSTDYKGYVRAYLPKGHSFVDVGLRGREGDFIFGGAAYQVPIRSNKTLHFDTTFSSEYMKKRSYTLNLWKQPGVFKDYYHITIRVPTGRTIVSRDFKATENIAQWEGYLTDDKALSLELGPDSYAPRALTQELTQLNQLDIWFNEPINPESVSAENIKVSDSNVKNPAADAMSITSAVVDGTHLTITTTGMTAQPEEKYVITVSGLSDYSNNALEGRTYSFYQRLK